LMSLALATVAAVNANAVSIDFIILIMNIPF
jgi:hypothetical protein